jgi:Ca2+-binding RTX toxin-like protein
MLHVIHASRALALVPLVTLLSLVPIATASAAVPRCMGERATIVGTDRGDALFGTHGRDVIVGLGGADTIRGLERRDLICAGSGDDDVRGGDGVDVVLGEQGDDRLVGGPGFFNQIWPGPGNDVADGGPAKREGSDELVYLDASSGIVADLAAGTVTGAGNDAVGHFEWLIGSQHDDQLAGSPRQHEVIFGAGGDDAIELRGGEDAAAGGAGDDQIDGGPGIDVLAEAVLARIYGQPTVTGPLTVDLGAGTATGVGSDALTSIEASQGSRGDDVMTGDGNDNEFTRLGKGDDLVDAAGGDDLVDGGPGVDDLAGGNGTDVLGALDSNAGMTIDLGAGTTSDGDTLSSFESVIGSFFDDVITGDGGANTIEGADGADTISGLAGDDVLFGGWADGFDDGSTDSVDGGPDNDACDAEVETNCESDPALMASAAGRFDVRDLWLDLERRR